MQHDRALRLRLRSVEGNGRLARKVEVAVVLVLMAAGVVYAIKGLVGWL